MYFFYVSPINTSKNFHRKICKSELRKSDVMIMKYILSSPSVRNEHDVHWKLSSQENFMRMKVKVIQNYNFDPHIEASRQRDNLGE